MDLKKILLKKDFEDILGQTEVKNQLKSALIMERHIILVGPPGCGKTTLVKNLAKLLPEITVNDCPYHCNPDDPACPECRNNKNNKTKKIQGEQRFIRIQGSPDLTSEDLLGDIDPIKAMKFGPMDPRSFTPGKIFKANNKILFFDEINRCNEKLQNSLLQALEEKQTTISSYDVYLKTNFIFIGTMNPDDVSTEPLSDVFIDRFDLIYMGYPEKLNLETKIVEQKGKKIIDFPKDFLFLTIKFIHDLRENKDLEKLPSVRASIGLYERAQANAFLDKRKNVKFEDIEKAIFSVLSHRIRLKPSVKYLQSPEDILQKELKRFKVENKIKKEKKSDVP
ncbi:AAA domain-containing protein [Candidatus Woesearchaeota archaeon]|nr:AAA domain-containing protein [Candidatus Woesearchaeota archaeon]